MRAYLVSFLGELADRLAPATKWPDRMAIVRETRLRLQIRRQQRCFLRPHVAYSYMTSAALPCLGQEREGVSLTKYI